MPWLSIIMWLLTFLASGGLKSGQAGRAALLATGVAAATYYTVEPTNPNAIWGDASREFFGMDPNPDPSLTTASQATNAIPSTMSSLGTAIVQETGEVLTEWGPTGTLGVIGGVAAITGSGIFGSVWTWVAIGVGALLVFGGGNKERRQA